jgi:hypothetical protein
MRKRRYTDDQLENAVKSSQSVAQVLRKLGLAPAGGNYEMIQKRISELDLDTSHFLGMAILRGKTHNYKKRSLLQILIHGRLENTWRLRNRLLSEGVKENRCECCLNTEWQGGSIPLELHHRDGDRTNNALANIVILCPNCHTQTDNYRGGNKKKV